MKHAGRIALLGVIFFTAGVGAGAADDVVIEHGKTRVTQSDLRRSIAQTVPDRQQALVYADRRRLSQHAGNFFTVRKLAEMAQERGLTEDELWRVEEARMRTLSQLQLDHMVEQVPQPAYEDLARETYRAYPERFHTDEAVRVEHVLVSAKERGEDEARKLAQKVLELARSGRDFGELVSEYSEDPSASKNGGDLGFFTKNQFVKPFEDAAFSLTEQGELAGPIATPFGFHVIQFVARRDAGLLPFEEIKESLIAAERDAFRTRTVNEIIEKIANLDGVKTNYEALMMLHKPIDRSNRAEPAQR